MDAVVNRDVLLGTCIITATLLSGFGIGFVVTYSATWVSATDYYGELDGHDKCLEMDGRGMTTNYVFVDAGAPCPDPAHAEWYTVERQTQADLADPAAYVGFIVLGLAMLVVGVVMLGVTWAKW